MTVGITTNRHPIHRMTQPKCFSKCCCSRACKKDWRYGFFYEIILFLHVSNYCHVRCSALILLTRAIPNDEKEGGCTLDYSKKRGKFHPYLRHRLLGVFPRGPKEAGEKRRIFEIFFKRFVWGTNTYRTPVQCLRAVGNLSGRSESSTMDT